MTNLRSPRGEEVRHVDFRAAEDSDGQTLEGYAAVFGQWTEIRDSLGTYQERIVQGAFKRTLGQRTPVLQFDHGSHPLIGSLPLGVIHQAREDRNGLFVRARLSDNWLIQPVRDAIRDRAIDGMSIRMRVVKDDWGKNDAGEDTRTISEVELLELGPVVFPAYEQTSVAMRSLVGALDDEARAELARELGTSTAAVEPATDDDGPDKPPVASRDNRSTIQALLAEHGLARLSKGDEHVAE
jgi:HK97 family phage prohead protease